MAYDPDVLFSGTGADPIEVEAILLEERELSWQVQEDEDSCPVWLPKSQCLEVERRKNGRGQEFITLAVPEWLAIKSGLV